MTNTSEIEKDDRAWMVVYTRPRFEKKIESSLLSRNIEAYCPSKKIEKQWSDRRKIIDEVIFRSYVFVRVNEGERLEVLQTDGVINFIYYCKKPAIVRDVEIDVIKKFLNDKESSVKTISSDEFRPETKVKINHGIFMDNLGLVVRSNKKRVYVQLDGLSQVMVIEFPIAHLTPIF